MSEDKSTSGGNSEGSSNTEGKDTVSHESWKKLLGEKKALQTKFADMQSKLDEIEQAKLEAEGKVKELNEKLKKDLESSRQKNVEIVKTVSNKAVRSQFFREAEKLGCLDPEIAMKACSFDDLEITDDFEFDNQKLVTKIQDLVKSKPYLFKKDVKIPKDFVPKGGEGEQIPLEKMTPEQLKERYKNLLKTGQ